MPACPICARPHQPTDARCGACGADLFDPDVRALAGATAQGEPVVVAPAGTLSAGRVLGITQEALADGAAVAKLGLGGAAVVALGWLLPVGQMRHGTVMAWDEAAGSLGLARWMPVILAVLAAGVALARRRLGPVAAGGALAVLGLAGFGLAVFPLGVAAYTPVKMSPIFPGVLIAAAAVVTRLQMPLSLKARQLLAVGAGLIVAGSFVPYPSLMGALPAELWSSSIAGSGAHLLLPTLLDGIGSHGPAGLLVGALALLPILVAPAAAVLAWPRPEGAWDQPGLRVRPLAWLLVLYLPLCYALLVFNVWGAPGLSDFLAARCRQLLLVLPFSLWAIFGAAAVLEGYLEKKST